MFVKENPDRKKYISRPYTILSINLLHLYNKEAVSCILYSLLWATIGSDTAPYTFEFAFLKVVFNFILYVYKRNLP